jgi:signal transduction histidine kinase
MGRFVEGTCEGVACSLVDLELESEPAKGRIAFPLRSRGECFGTLLVDTSGRGPLTDRELWICQIVAHSAAGALYSAAQSTQAENASRTKDEFLATVSHEFRTPLHAILGYLEILDSSIDTESSDPLVEESIERMRVNGCRLKNLLEELLTFAELRAGYGRVVAEPVSVSAIFDELGQRTREQVSEKPVTVSWQVDSDADAMTTDRRKVVQALSGLLSNAAKFTEQGRIHAMARRTGDDIIELTVSDTGIGIASSDLALVFDDFRQVDGSFTRRYGGLGVGLPLVRELANLLGGKLEVDSELGGGTTVRLRLPREVSGRSLQLERSRAAGRRSRVAEPEQDPIRHVG